MYKRRTKSGGLGIVRMVSKTQQNVPDSEEAKNSVSSSHSNKETSKAIITNDDPSLSMDKDSNRKRQVKTPEPEDSDEVLSDSEPSPKKTRRFFNSTSTVLRDHTLSNKMNQSKVESSASKTPSPTHRRKCSEKQLRSIDPADTISKTTKVNKKLTQVPLNSSNNYNRTAKETKNPTSSIFIANDEHKTKAHEKLKEDLRKDRKLSYLEEVFEQAGLILSNGSSANVLRTDQAVFVRDIKNAICSNEEESKRNVKQIMKDLEEYCSDDKCLKYAISSTETAEDCDVSRGATQDSVMRLLLHIDCLQAPVTELLLMDKLAKFIMDEPSGDLAVITWVRMILQCFRFLERMNNGKAVNDQLLEIVLVSTDTLIQQEVILSLPDIIQDTEHHYTALELSKLVRKSNPQVMTSALEALTNLSLQPEVRTQIQPTLLRAINKIPHDYLPTMLKFLFADGDAASVDEVITFLRNELDLEETSGNSASVQVLVFMTLRDALLVSRTLPTIWLKNISSVKTQAEHKPIDIVMLLVLLSVSSDNTRHRAIEAVFRSKIRAEMFTETIINETLKAYIPVIKEHFQVTIKLAGALLKSPEPAVVEFASKIYIGMFVNMEGLWCKWVLSDLQQGVGTGDTGMARAALSVIQHLTTNHHHKVKPLGVILMLLLNKLNDLALSEVCQLMDILCHIAYSEDDESSENCTMLQDEINILVQKQLASSQLSVKRNGIIGCVMTIKHVTTVSESTTDSLASEKNHTSDKAAKASQLLELLLSSTKDCVEAQGLALDQLSHLLISGKALDPTFVTKLSSLMRDKLQDDFLISASDFVSKDDVIETSLQFYLDDDPEGSIALNLADLVVNEQNSERMRSTVGVSCLHPLLRLLRGLEMSDLSEIDALLGCHICLPTPQVYTEFGQVTDYQQHVSLHCLFHCVNWLIEIVNCFSYLIKKNEPEKVVMRVRLIVWLRGLLSRCLPLAMQYTPPVCYFQALPRPKANSSQEKPAKKKTKRKGKKKSKKNQEDQPLTGTVAEMSHVSEEEEEEVTEERLADLTKYRVYFRELDIDVWLVLTQPLTLAPTPEKDGQFTAELGPSELLYLLDDYVSKLSHSLTASHKRISFLKTANSNNVVGFENLDKFPPLHIAKNTIKLLSFLCGFLEKTVEFTQNLVKVNDGILDSTGMFMEGSAEIKMCQARLLRILAILFSWVGLQSPANSNYLLAALQKVAGRVSGEQAKTKSRPQLVRDCVQYLTQCHEHVLDLTSACTLVDTIKAFMHHAEQDNSIRSQIANLCGEFLERRWYDMKGNREKGAALNSQVGELLSNYLTHSADQLKTVTDILGWLSTQHQQLAEKDGALSTFPSFSRLNLHVLITGLLKGLERAVRQRLEDQSSDRDQLQLWSSLTQGLETLVAVVKANDSKPNLRAFMKGCTAVLKLFLSQGMSTCRFMFKHEPATVSQVLKKLQVTTRYLQTICNYVKVSKDTGLTQYLPPIRAVLESILLQVRSIIVINNCTDAFFMGSMKNRDLKGQEIPSQIEGEEEELNSLHNGSDSEQEKEKDDGESSAIETDIEGEEDDASNSISI